MIETEEGIVIALEGNHALIRVMRHGDCKNCGACPGDDATMMRIRNTLQAVPGQRVAFEMKKESMLSAAFIVYMLPLAAMTGGYTVGWFLSIETGLPPIPCEVFGAATGLFLSLLNVKRYDTRFSDNAQTLPETVQILSEAMKDRVSQMT